MTADEAGPIAVLPGSLPSVVAKTVARNRSLFQDDVEANSDAIGEAIRGKRILVTGAAGSIGSATIRQMVRYKPAFLAAIDLSENNLVELVRDLRGRTGLAVGDSLKTYTIDFGSTLADQFIRDIGPFDLVLHFAAMKHVRSERDIYSLARLIQTNVLQVDRFLSTLKQISRCDVFAVSTDKACAPASLMGASKRLMEQVVIWHGQHSGSLISIANGDRPSLSRVACTRFANVAFSDGSLLAGYLSRIRKRQALAGPNDVRRYFITEDEAGQICLLTAALAENGQIFVPRLDPESDLKTFDQIAEIVLNDCGYEPCWYSSADAARNNMERDLARGVYPCFFSASDTSGEKEFEEFIGPGEKLTSSPFASVNVIGRTPVVDSPVLKEVMDGLTTATASPDPGTGKEHIVELLFRAVPTLRHVERDRDLDRKM